eukprot:8447765-Pyramimonas_sp.AAC.1
MWRKVYWARRAARAAGTSGGHAVGPRARSGMSSHMRRADSPPLWEPPRHAAPFGKRTRRRDQTGQGCSVNAQGRLANAKCPVQ